MKNKKIRTLFIRKISRSYKVILFILISILIVYNLYLKEYYIVLILAFLTYMISYKKEIYFNENGMINEYQAFWYHQERITFYQKIDKVEVYIEKEIVFLKVYNGIFYLKIPMLNSEYQKLKNYLLFNKVIIFEKIH